MVIFLLTRSTRKKPSFKCDWVEEIYRNNEAHFKARLKYVQAVFPTGLKSICGGKLLEEGGLGTMQHVQHVFAHVELPAL